MREGAKESIGILYLYGRLGSSLSGPVVEEGECGSRRLRHLYAACGPSKIEWYLNNERIRREIIPNLADRVAFGATGPVALNAEIKRWFSGVVQMHASVFKTEAPRVSSLQHERLLIGYVQQDYRPDPEAIGFESSGIQVDVLWEME